MSVCLVGTLHGGGLLAAAVGGDPGSVWLLCGCCLLGLLGPQQQQQEPVHIRIKKSRLHCTRT